MTIVDDDYTGQKHIEHTQIGVKRRYLNTPVRGFIIIIIIIISMWIGLYPNVSWLRSTRHEGSGCFFSACYIFCLVNLSLTPLKITNFCELCE